MMPTEKQWMKDFVDALWIERLNSAEAEWKQGVMLLLAAHAPQEQRSERDKCAICAGDLFFTFDGAKRNDGVKVHIGCLPNRPLPAPPVQATAQPPKSKLPDVDPSEPPRPPQPPDIQRKGRSGNDRREDTVNILYNKWKYSDSDRRQPNSDRRRPAAPSAPREEQKS